jgi:D-serine deaminase-like pyridoxal phosphate-dependent protein
MNLDNIPTPALILDRLRLEVNAKAMSERAKRLGVDLRPHMKTAKCVEVARMATAGHSGGITVSTLREAEFFFARGFNDITYAVGIVPGKLEQAFNLMAKGARLTLLTDNVVAAQAICKAARGRGLMQRPRVLIELDCGDNRGGISPFAPDLEAVAATLAAEVEVAGVLTHAGSSYYHRGEEEIARVAEYERLSVVDGAEILGELGYSVDTFSVGSTPTATFARDLSGVTEMRPGVYLFGDMDQVGMEVMPEDRVAVTVLATVIGAYDNRVVVDAGGLALSKDESARRHEERVGFGKVLDLDGRPLGAWVDVANQEHGIVKGADRTRLKVGDRVRILPNHICMTAAAHPGYYVVDGGREVAARWPRVNGWEEW